MKVVITGTSKGIGLDAAQYFLSMGHKVIGLDILDEPYQLTQWDTYTHYKVDVRDKKKLPDIENVDILVNNAGVQNSGHDIETNLIGTINCTEKYGVRKGIKSILNVASVSAHNGAEFPEYCASKGGMLAYTINTAKRVAEFGATCNSLSPGGVLTAMNKPVIDDDEKWDKVMEQTPLRKWASTSEISEWIYFLTCINSSMTAQDVIVDNGETFNHKFVW